MPSQPAPASSLSAPRAAVSRAPLAVVWTYARDLPMRLRRPVSHGAYRPEVDGLRFIAIVIVIGGHLAERLVRFFESAHDLAADNWLGGLVQRPGLGVYLFFTVSGFIIAGQAARAKAPPLSLTFLRTYFSRRVLRIEPPYVIVLLATFVFMTATGYTPDGARQFFARPESLAASLATSVVYLHGLIWGAYPRLFPPGWSLEVEVQFYVLAPLFFAAWFAVRGRARVALGLLGLVGGSLLSLLAPREVSALHVEASILRFAHFFWLGLVLCDAQAFLAAWLARRPALVADGLGWGGMAVYLVLPNAPEPAGAAELALGLALRVAALASVAAMFTSVFAPRSGFRDLCARPWVSLIGGACYSIYLTHLQAIQAMTAFAAKFRPQAGIAELIALGVIEIVVVLAIGLIFYALVERTFMRPDWPRAFRTRCFPSFAARIARR